MVALPIYLDNNATTRTDPQVLESMLPYFTEVYGNASSRNHAFGWAAEEAVEVARGQVADILKAHPKEIIFTSGATESDNLAVKGVARMYGAKGRRLITVVTEHKAVLDPCRRLEREGFTVTYLPVDQHGRIAPEQVADAMTDETILVSVMFANNEIGTLQPIAEIGALCHERGVLFHTDAAQAVGKIAIDVEAMSIDLLSLSGHKMYGPKGIGALYVRRRNPRVRLEPMIDGGGHERGMRSGTLPVPNIVGLGTACALCGQAMSEEAERIRTLRDRLYREILERVPGVRLNGHPTDGLPGLLNLSFEHVEGEALMMGMKDVAVSSGSACTSASLEPSYVLRALGIGDDLAHSSLRFGVGRFTTREEIDYVVDAVAQTVHRLRALGPACDEITAVKPSAQAGAV